MIFLIQSLPFPKINQTAFAIVFRV